MACQNEAEEKALIEFRNQLTELSLLENLEKSDDHFLLRWLRARNLDVKNAIEMIKNYLEWKNNNEEYKMAHSEYWAPSELIVDELKYKFTGLDHAGRPVLWMPIARYDVKGLLKKGLKPDCFGYCYKIMDHLMLEIEKQILACGATQFVSIIDSAELTLEKITHIETIQCLLRFMKEFDAYYPELIHSCYIVNAPWIFSTIFNMAKSILSKTTLRKINIFDSNEEKWKKVLLENLPESALPIEYGGTASPVLSCYKKTSE